MNSEINSLKWTLALVRIVLGVIFILFGQYKLLSPAFAHGGIQQYIARWIEQGSAVSFYLPFLKGWVQPHAIAFGYFVGAGELLIGLALLSGILVRYASIFGVLFMLNLLLAEWNGVGANAPVWQYFGAQLDHICPLLLFCIFAAETNPRLNLWNLIRREKS